MPKNTTGGKHKGRKNGEGNTAKKNRLLIEAFISDIRSEGECDQIHVARVVQRAGNGRMGVFWVDEKKVARTANVPIKGSLRGRGKSQARIEIGSVVIMNETGLGGSHAFEIIAVMTDEQVSLIKDEMDLDPRILAKNVVDTAELLVGVVPEAGFEFDYSRKPELPDEGEIDISAI
jgi:hypothetical protein